MLLEGGNIQAANNSNYSYWNNPTYNKRMLDAARLSGNARYEAYGKLDVDIMRNQAPWAPMHNGNTREFVASRIANYIYHPVYAAAVLNAMAGQVGRRSGGRRLKTVRGAGAPRPTFTTARRTGSAASASNRPGLHFGGGRTRFRSSRRANGARVGAGRPATLWAARRGVRAAEGARLEIAYASKGVSRVQIRPLR